MKKIAILLSLAVFVLTLVSCGGPEADAKKMVNKIKNYTEVATKVGEDKVIDDNEAEELKKLSEDLEKFQEKIDKKYEGKDEEKKKMDKYFEDNQEEMNNVYEEFFKALMALYECEGSDKLE